MSWQKSLNKTLFFTREEIHYGRVCKINIQLWRDCCFSSPFYLCFFSDRKEKKEEKDKNNKILNELSTSNNNIAESLNLLKTSIDINTAEYRQHDERSIKEFSNINEHLIEIKAKLDK